MRFCFNCAIEYQRTMPCPFCGSTGVDINQNWRQVMEFLDLDLNGHRRTPGTKLVHSSGNIQFTATKDNAFIVAVSVGDIEVTHKLPEGSRISYTEESKNLSIDDGCFSVYFPKEGWTVKRVTTGGNDE
jgi:hypothetical protein